MKPILFLLKPVVVALCAALVQCSPSASLTGGNSSQTGNTGIVIVSSAKSIYGATVPDAHVSIFDQAFKPYMEIPGFSDSTIANDSGRFSILLSREGYFDIFINDVRHGNQGFIHHVPVFGDSIFKDTVDTLKHPGFISGNATDTAGKIYPLSFVYILGSPFYTVTRNNGDFLLGPLPAGKYSPGIVLDTSGMHPVTAGRLGDLLDTNVMVVPDGISQWK